MKITKEWLQSKNACISSLSHVCNNGYIDLDTTKFINKLIKNKRLNDANWLITKYMNQKQCVQYAIYAAEQVIDIFKNKYPNDTRPRKAIQTAKEYVKNPCKKTKKHAYADAAADDAAYAAAYAADDAAYAAAAAAAYAADAAAAADAYAASASAADAADAAAAADAYAASAANDAAYAADAAGTAAYAADDAAYAAAADAYAADDAADAYAAAAAMKIKIIKNGLKIIK